MDLVISWINLGITLAGIIIGILVLLRVSGKLKLGVIFLILSLIIIVIRETLIILHIEQSPIAVGLMRLVAVLFILIAILSMRSMIKKIDHDHQKGYKKKYLGY